MIVTLIIMLIVTLCQHANHHLCAMRCLQSNKICGLACKRKNTPTFVSTPNSHHLRTSVYRLVLTCSVVLLVIFRRFYRLLLTQLKLRLTLCLVYELQVLWAARATMHKLSLSRSVARATSPRIISPHYQPIFSRCDIRCDITNTPKHQTPVN